MNTSSQSPANESDALLPTPQTDNLLRNKQTKKGGTRTKSSNNTVIFFLLCVLAIISIVGLNHWRVSSQPMEIVTLQLLPLAPQLQGRIVVAGDEDFDEASQVWRQDVVANNPPLAVIEAYSEQDVQLMVPILAKLSKDYKIPFRIRSGGHNKAGFSTTHGIVLSLKHMRKVGIVDYPSTIKSPAHPTTQVVVASIQPGATVEVVLDELLQQKQAGGTVGICGNVAEGGFVLGGGIGFMSRSLGLGIDNVLSFRVVLYNGTVVTANATSHPELFFALRGAGSGNFGVVTEMEYKLLHPMPTEQQARMISIPMEEYASFLYHLGKNPPSREFMTIFDMSAEEGVTAMAAWFSSDPKIIAESEERFQTEIAPLIPNSNYQQVPWTPFDWADGTHNFSDRPGYSVHLYAEQVWQGFLMPQNNTLEIWEEIVSLIQDIITECPDVHPDIELWGGAISDVAHNETAFAWRKALFNVGVQLYVLDESQKDDFEEQVQKVNAWWPSVAKYLDGAYVNYPMNSLKEDEYPRLYWGDHLERLIAVKKEYDPMNIFQYEQSMPTNV